MSKINEKLLRKALRTAIEAAYSAGGLLIENFRDKREFQRDGNKDVHSVFDHQADNIIIKSICDKFPDHSIMTEESGLINGGSEYVWVIDPIDGTSNFVNGNPFFAVSIALLHKKEIVLGVINAPVLEEMYTAVCGNRPGAEVSFRLSEKANVSNVSQLKDSYIVFCEGGSKDKSKTREIFNKYYPKVKDMKKLGSAALELAWVGTGRAEAYITTDIMFWDIAAGIIFVKKAGGKILDFSGKEIDCNEMNFEDGYDIMATNGKVSL